MLNDYLKEIHAALRAGNRDKATKLSKRLTSATGMDALTQLTLIKELFDSSEGQHSTAPLCDDAALGHSEGTQNDSEESNNS